MLIILDAIIFIKICESFLEIDGMIKKPRHFKVYWGQKQVSEIFRTLQNR